MTVSQGEQIADAKARGDVERLKGIIEQQMMLIEQHTDSVPESSLDDAEFLGQVADAFQLVLDKLTAITPAAPGNDTVQSSDA